MPWAFACGAGACIPKETRGLCADTNAGVLYHYLIRCLRLRSDSAALHDSVEAGSQDAQFGSRLGNVAMRPCKHLLDCLALGALQGGLERTTSGDPGLGVDSSTYPGHGFCYGFCSVSHCLQRPVYRTTAIRLVRVVPSKERR